MKKTISVISLLLYFSAGQLFSQTGSITGTVTDSLTGLPVAGMAVFIPSSTYGTTTGNTGKFTLNRLPSGDYTLAFRHMGYRPLSGPVTVDDGKQVIVNVRVLEITRMLDEVVVVGKKPDWDWGYRLFKEYFLGDPFEMKCTLQNPRDLKFYYDGDILTAYAKEPLVINNRYLGYRITYFLDYFKFAENKNPFWNSVHGSYYAFSGNALYQDLPVNLRFSLNNRNANRESEFRGSLRHFLASLYQDKLTENHYNLRKAYQGINDLQITENIAFSMAKIKMAQADSVFIWYPEKEGPEYLSYIPADEFFIPAGCVTEGPLPGMKTAVIKEFLLAFYDFDKFDDLKSDCISALRIPGGTIIFDKDGNYRVPGGKLEWTRLDNTVRMRVMLPTDYLPKEGK